MSWLKARPFSVRDHSQDSELIVPRVSSFVPVAMKAANGTVLIESLSIITAIVESELSNALSVSILKNIKS